MNYVGRLERLKQAMVNGGLDGLVYGIGANFQYFTGLPVEWQREHETAEPECLMVLSRDREPCIVIGCGHDHLVAAGSLEHFTIYPQEEAVAVLRSHLRGQRFGVSRKAADYLQQLIVELVPDAECVVAEELGEEMRYVKDVDEISILRRAATLTDQVMERVVPHIRPGITQLDLQAMIMQTGLSLGAQDVSFPPAGLYVKSGTEANQNPFVYPQEKGLVAGTSIAFDFGFVLDGYCSDFGRSFYCGPAPDYISGAYRALQDGQCHLISQLKPGVKISEFYSILERFLDERGYGDRLRARLPDGTLGHQIGVDLHENPWLKPSCDMELRPGMVMAIEPKLWLPGEYYLRVEDIVLITEEGAESLTNFDRQLFELPLGHGDV